jgi:hypothetical protein
MENKEELVSSFDLLTEMFDGINNEKRWISYDGDGLHIYVYDNPSDLLELKIGEKAKPPLLKLRLVEVNGESIEEKTSSCNVGYAITTNSYELEKNLNLLERIIKINQTGYTDIKIDLIRMRVEQLIINNEY